MLCEKKYIYLIQSSNFSKEYYTGITDNIKDRLTDHNTGKSPHTTKYKPWKLICYTAFADENKAFAFEKYLKSGSGRAFSSKHFK